VVTGTPDSGQSDSALRLTAWLHGHVQGVGMRWWVRARALEHGLSGWARNTEDGRVEVVAEGAEEQLHRFIALLRDPQMDRPGRVVSVTERWMPAQGDLSSFHER